MICLDAACLASCVAGLSYSHLKSTAILFSSFSSNKFWLISSRLANRKALF